MHPQDLWRCLPVYVEKRSEIFFRKGPDILSSPSSFAMGQEYRLTFYMTVALRKISYKAIANIWGLGFLSLGRTLPFHPIMRQ